MANAIRAFPSGAIEYSRSIYQVFPTTRAFPTIDKAKFNLYPVVDDVNWIEHLLKLGVKTVQLRIKDPTQGDLEAQIIRAIALGREFNAQVFINDYWQLAIKHQAYGVHLGQEDLTSANLTELLDAGIRLGFRRMVIMSY